MTERHYLHLVTGREIDYNHSCRSCAHYSERTRLKVKIIGCALAPELDGENFGEVRSAFPACDGWVNAGKPRPLGKGRG